MVQLVPSQASASVAELVKELPTAVHALADPHDTRASVLSLDPVGLGVAWTVQLVPSQRSASVTTAPELPL